MYGYVVNRVCDCVDEVLGFYGYMLVYVIFRLGNLVNRMYIFM